MAMAGISLIQKQTQTMVMTPQLQHAIKLLQMNHVELTEEIMNEMMTNPILELTPPANSQEGEAENSLDDPDYDQTPPAKAGNGDGAEFADQVGTTEEKIREDIDWENYLEEYSSAPSTTLAMGSHETPEETPGFETYTAAKTSLSELLISQWTFAAKDKADYARGEIVIGNLNENGYLAATIHELADQAKCRSREMLQTLSRVQELDPAGIAARDLRECLLLQLERLGLQGSLAHDITKSHLALVEKKDLQGLRKALETQKKRAVTKEEVMAALGTLKNLDPSPGLAYSTTDPVYVTPDVYITKVGDEYAIKLNEDGMPRLRFSSAYRHLLQDKNSTPETKKYLSEKLKGATFLIKSIHQRQKTIYRVTECIFKFQRDFLDLGVEYLKPLVLRDVAEELGFHESTISRVTTNKYVDTPRGIFELKYFFDSPITRFVGDSLSSESVKNRIKQIINSEDPQKPLSDQKIVEILRGANIKIARRTVAKYREILHLGSSSERKTMG